MAVVIFSGGLDSTVLLTAASRGEDPVVALSFDYGQRHRRELESAEQIANLLGVAHHVVDLAGVGQLLGGSALTDEAVPVPDGHYAEESMKATIVPNRNAIMLSVAVGYAVANGHDEVLFGAHAGDHFIYPDCRPAFVDLMDATAQAANDGIADVRVRAPFRTATKTDIALLGAKIDAPLAMSWSCYKGGTEHCGTCGTCVERREAFAEAELADPTIYQERVA